MVQTINIEDVPENIKDKIIKNYLIRYYHWTIGSFSFVIGILLGILIS
jgi:hypothetical protein